MIELSSSETDLIKSVIVALGFHTMLILKPMGRGGNIVAPRCTPYKGERYKILRLQKCKNKA